MDALQESHKLESKLTYIFMEKNDGQAISFQPSGTDYSSARFLASDTDKKGLM